MGGQRPVRGPDPAHEGLASGPPPCSAITLQSGPRNPSQKTPGFMSEITRRPYKRCTASFTKRFCVPTSRQACQCRWWHVCCGEGRQLQPLPQFKSPPVSGTGWRGRSAVRRFALLLQQSSLAESRSLAALCMRPAEGDGHLCWEGMLIHVLSYVFLVATTLGVWSLSTDG